MMGRLSHLLNADPLAIAPGHVERERVYSDREAYRLHKLNATRRGIAFLFTFEEWMGWWKVTGHYEQRGNHRGEYVMARKGDQGPYVLGNVECIRAEVNSVLPHLGKPKSNEWKAKLRNTLAAKRKGANQ